MQGLKRIFSEVPLEPAMQVDGKWHHYLKNVLRMDSGDEIVMVASDAIGVYQISKMGKKHFDALQVSVRPSVKPNYRLEVYQCILKREYMDVVVQKYAELGVTRIIPVVSGRSQVGGKLNRERLDEIAKMAVLQSENEWAPELTEPVDIADIAPETAENIVFYERQTEKVTPALRGNSASMIIGPEGGFTDEECALLLQKGFQPYSPLSAILKAETAAVVFAGLLRMQMEGV